LPAIIQNIINLLDFGLDIETSVHRPRFGGFDIAAAARGVQKTMIEADVSEVVRKAAARRGIAWSVVNPWNWFHGSFEGIWIDPETREMHACGDPRRTAQAMAL
jgi:gamma-glutamyltranspeptidase/glutathione hydrolase